MNIRLLPGAQLDRTKREKDATINRYSNEDNMAKRSANLNFAALIITNETPQKLVIPALK